MKALTPFVLFAALATASTALAGRLAGGAVPTLGEAGVVTFAVGLLGGGVFLLRRRNR